MFCNVFHGRKRIYDTCRLSSTPYLIYFKFILREGRGTKDRGQEHCPPLLVVGKRSLSIYVGVLNFLNDHLFDNSQLGVSFFYCLLEEFKLAGNKINVCGRIVWIVNASMLEENNRSREIRYDLD